ncbi:MAG TPA: hypothetical protein VHA52_03185 [Candidatus Babeliaceae bacterium]|nr:hypothetical protein [Candidatus Babeliaceae bacterium]
MKQLPYKIDRPDDVMKDGQQYGMVIIPAYQHGIYAQHHIDNAFVPVLHDAYFW